MSVSTCPSDDQLQEMLAGSLEPAATETLIAHVDDCKLCQSRVADLESEAVPDNDLAGLRERSATPNTSLPDWMRDVTPGSSRQTLNQVELPCDIGPYRLVRRIAAGGMGTVFEAKHRRLGRPFALKILAGDRRLTRLQAERIRREWQAHGSLVHPNIVGATDAGIADGMPYLVTERIDGVDLSRLVKAAGPLSPQDACALICDVAAGLHYAHEQDLVHGDVKPSNLMIDRLGNAKVLDLGTARLRSERDDSPMLGTLAFMAPEQFDHPPQCGVTSDVYSLGCTFYFLLTSRTPFGHQQDRSKEQLVHAHRSEAPAPLCSVTGDADETLIELQPVIDQMLAKDPKERQSSMTEVVARLETLATSSDCERLLATVSLDADTSAMQVDPTHGLTSLLKVGDEDSNRSKRIFRGRAGVMGVAIAILLTLGAAFAIRRLSGAWKDAFVSRESDVPIERSEGVTWKASPRTGTLDGLVLSPAKLRGIDEWQMETIAPRGHVLCLDWSRNGEYLLVTSTDGHSRVYRWDERDLRLVTIFADRRHRFFSAKWARDGHSIFAHTDGGLCKIDFSTGEIQDALELSEINQIGVHPNEPLLGVATKTGLKLVSTETLSLQANQIDGAIGRLDWSPRGDRIAVSRGDMIQIHSFEEGHFTNQPSATAVSPSPVRDIKWTPDGKHVGIARRVNPDLLRASNLRAVFRVLGPPEMESISFRDRDNKSAMGYRDTFSWYVDKKLLQRPEFEQPSGRAQVAWRPRGDCIAIGQDGLLRVLDTDGKTLSQLGGRQAIAEAASSENGRFQVVVGDHRQIELDADGRGIRSQTLAELGSQSDGDVKRRRVATTIAFDETHDLHAGNEFQIRRASDGAIIETIAVSKRYGLRHGFLCRHPSASQFISWGGDGSNSDSNGSDTLVCWDVDGISPRWSLILDGNGNAATVTPAGELIDSVGSPITSLTWIVRRGDRTTLHDRESFELLTAE